VSPRSEELLGGARDRLGAARAAIASGFPSAAASSAYYSMLYAARAALSEEDRNAKTHSGTWGLFQEAFVATRRFPEELFADARRTQRLREAADYDAVEVSREEAEQIVALADRFLAAVVAAIDR
jgi:uncharacterized protein (UPF0332 family)